MYNDREYKKEAEENCHAQRTKKKRHTEETSAQSPMTAINIPEVLAANGAGAVIVVLLFLFRIRQQQTSQLHERLFNVMLISILAALIAETTSYCIDGRDFPGCSVLQYITNTVCLSQTSVVGFLWCLFVDYRIYCSPRRLKKKAALLSIPMAVILMLMVVNLFGNGILFVITPENEYARGTLNLLIYVVLFLFFVESIVNVRRARQREMIPFVFPVYCFVVLCMIGTVIQGFFYGLSIGWLSASIAVVFAYLELQTANSYVDAVSGLCNRQYINHHLTQVVNSGGKLHGILLDINDFKAINDIHGHSVGDRAICAMGKILNRSIFHNAIAMRMGGDEFVVFLSESSHEECQAQMEAIRNQIEEFNQNENELFDLSVSMGSACLDGNSVEDFFAKMDSTMYEVKRNYHLQKKNQS